MWSTIENLFRDNKEARAIQLGNELRNLQIGDLSVHDYCQKMKTLSDLLANVNAPVNDRALVRHLLNGLSSKFDNIINVIKHRSPPCSFNDARSMLKDEEDRLKIHRRPDSSHIDHASSPQVLLAASLQQYDQRSSSPASPYMTSRGGSRNNRGNRGGGRHYSNNKGRGNSNWNGGNWNSQQSPWPTPPQWPNQPQWPAIPQWPMYPQWPNIPNWPTSPWPQSNNQTRFSTPSLASPVAPRHSPGILGPSPLSTGSAYLTATHQPPPQFSNDMIPTSLATAFNSMTLADPSDAAWYMDSAATTHLTSQPGTLSTISSSPHTSLPRVTVGNGSMIPVTASGYTSFPSVSRPLHLNNVHLCPKILKNLVSVRQFTVDNSCSVEFDPYGFLVKDLQTRTPLIRCDSTGPLYSVSSPSASNSLHALIYTASASTWHRRLEHPGHSVFRILASSGLFDCSKTDISSLCHACQLGKHIRQPFYSSTASVLSPFEIIHSDVWTSPVSSVSGIKYYVIFLDQFSHFVWIYPLRQKSEVFEKFFQFFNYVKTHFQTPIKSFQCDNGGEFNNRQMLVFFSTHGIQPRFSCPHTSAQNGRAERTLRTINNLVRALLFQAKMPNTYWVEALNMAAHLFNLLPSTAIDNQIPFTRLFNKQASYDHLRVFGCFCYPNLLPTTPNKLSPR